MGFLLFLIAAGLSIYGWLADSDTATTISWVVWALGLAVVGIGFLRNRGKFKSMAEAQAAADAGDPRGLRVMALVAKINNDFETAEGLLRQAVDKGDVESMWEMGRLIEQRDGLEASEPWFRMAAERGHFFAKRFFRPGHALNMKGDNPL